MARILLADDDDSLRVALAKNLEKLGHSVFQAKDGKEAELKFNKDRYDLVISDIRNAYYGWNFAYENH